MRRRTWIGLGGVALAALLAWGCWPPANPDPVVGGKHLSAWLDERRRPTPDGPVTLSAEAIEAVRSLGPDALPTLLAWSRVADPAYFRGAILVRRVLGIRGALVGDADERIRAALGFQALGSAGRAAWPALVDMILNGDDSRALAAMFAFHDADADAARLFLPAATGPDRATQARAMLALSRMPRAAGAVGLPTLERLKADPDPATAAQATRLITYMDGMLKWSVPNLKHPDADIRLREARFIGGHGDRARAYLPDLEAAADDPDPAARAAVAEAIRRIEGVASSRPQDRAPAGGPPRGGGEGTETPASRTTRP